VSDSVVGVLAFFKPALNYSLRYSDGISTRPGVRVKSVVQNMSPSVSFMFAERITLTYSPSYSWYSSDALNDKVSHRVSAKAGGEFGRFDVGMTQGYSRTSELLLETGLQTDQESWATTLTASTPVLEKSSLEWNVGRNTRSASAFTDVVSWSSILWFRHKMKEGLGMLIGAGGGYNEIDPGADTDSQQVTGGLNWLPGPRLSVDLTAGFDRTYFRGSRRGAITNPVYNASARYRLFETTSVSLGVSRSILAAYYADRITDNDRYSLGLSQRLFGRFNLGLGASLGSTRYVGRSLSSTVPARSDRYSSYSAALGTHLKDQVSITVSWQRGESESNVQDFTYDSSSWGLSLGWRF